MNRVPNTIYAVKPRDLDGPIKIGVTSNLTRRLRHINNQSPIPMALIGSMKGDATIERRIHASLLSSHERCEWFTATDDVIEMADAIARGDVDIDNLPEPIGVTSFINGRPVDRCKGAAA